MHGHVDVKFVGEYYVLGNTCHFAVYHKKSTWTAVESNVAFRGESPGITA